VSPATPFVSTPWQSPLSVSSVLVEGPTEEPFTLDEAKLLAGLDWDAGDPRDDLMSGFIAAARSQVEQDTGLALLTQTRTVTITAPYGGAVPLPVQALPVQSITDPTGSDVIGAPPSVLTAGTWLIVSGWPDAATLQAEAPLLRHAVGLLIAHYATLGRDLATIDAAVVTIPYGYAEAIAPYQLVWVP
jgi:hypothetical protein